MAEIQIINRMVDVIEGPGKVKGSVISLYIKTYCKNISKMVVKNDIEIYCGKNKEQKWMH